MSPDDRRRQSHFTNCEAKRSYPTRRIAESILRRIRKNSTLDTYRCERCGRWHIGNKLDVWERLVVEVVKACRNAKRERVNANG